MKRALTKGLLYLSIGFVTLFCLRLGYGYLYPNDRAFTAGQTSALAEMFDFARKNYASEKMKVERSSEVATYSVDQKYEKVASLLARTQRFDDDEKRLRGLTTKYNALIQFEQNVGLPGQRRLNLAIGVPPEKFDGMVGEIKTIGTLAAIRIDKLDKTNEYKDLNAKRVSLEKAREALLKLKNVGGKIEESINLENRILEIETEIQEMGVKLGEYDQENEFCTIKLGLEERGAISAGIPLLTRVKVALEWTIKYYLALLATLFIAVLLVWVTVALLERFKLISAAVAQAQRI